ncbi:MAG TPA: hypothetical protein VMS60_02635 [Solirubrobacterales bacterium]|nr:hypothetical protein [Solirubrobacterales bacterium]
MAAAALAIFLTACGGSDDGGDTAAETSAPAVEEGSSSAEGGAPAGDGIAPPGATYKVGDTAHVGWVLTEELKPTLDSGEPQAIEGNDLAVTVESVEEASIDDFDGLELDADEADNIPFYVTAKFEALEDLKVKEFTDSPASELAAYTDGDELLTPEIFIGAFGPCTTEATPPADFGAGDSYESCQAYLLPEGTSIAELRWTSGPSKEGEFSPYDTEPVVWEAG